MGLGNRVLQKRLEKNLRQEDVVDALLPDVRMSTNRLSGIEREIRKIDYVEAIKLIEILDITIDDCIALAKEEMKEGYGPVQRRAYPKPKEP